METLATAFVTDRALRLGQVKFMALDDAPQAPAQEAPAPCEPPALGPHAPARGFRLLQLLRRIASRVDGRPGAARP